MKSKKILALLLAVLGVFLGALSAYFTLYFNPVPQAPYRQSTIQPHPGTITEKNLFDHTENSIPAEQFSAADQFVYTKGWKETQNPNDADSVLPIVVREITPLSKTGEPTSREKAATMHIKEYGSSGLLRERTILAPSTIILPPPKIIDGKK